MSINTEQHYENLHKALNRFDLKVPRSKKFTELLKLLYTPEEAELLAHFGKPYTHAEKVEITSEKTGKNTDYIRDVFSSMVDKGTLFSMKDEAGDTLFSLPPFIPGIYEFYTMSENDPFEKKKEILKVLDDYFFETFVPEAFNSSSYPWFRVLPAESTVNREIRIDEKLSPETRIMPYEIASEYIATAETIALGNCACREHAEMQDGEKRCDRPIDVCLVFDNVARYWIDKGIGRSISHEEAEEVLKRSADAGLVHCTTNNQHFDPNMSGMICNCCPCCCFILQGILKSKNQLGIAQSNFQPHINRESCSMCMKCIDACPADALYHHKPHEEDFSDNFVALDKRACIGCGLCVLSCQKDSIEMVKVNDIVPEPDVWQSGFRHKKERNH